MPPDDIIYFDIAAVVVMAVCLLSFLMRRFTNRPATRVYFASMVLVLLTAIACLGGEIYDAFIGPFLLSSGIIAPQYFIAGRSALTLLFYALRNFTAPAYLILIATVSDTTYRLNNSTLKRLLLWVPMMGALLFVLTNPLHHLVYYYDGGISHRGAGIGILYAVAVYYSLIGMGWLLKWRVAFDDSEFSILMMLFPFMFIAVYIQYYFPFMRVDMFATAVAMMLISAFVIPPEKHTDTHVRAANLHAYREKCRHAFLTGQPLCLTYLQVSNLEQLRELASNDELQDMLGFISQKLSASIEHDDVLYYLRNGTFCIVSRDPNAKRALSRAHTIDEAGKIRPKEAPVEALHVGMRTCVVRVPEDVNDAETLRIFVHRFAHLVPEPAVCTYAELSQHPDFSLQMSLGSVVDRAIANRSFEVYYQPICCLKDGRFHSAEALIRLHDEEFGWVSPALFIPESEQNGTIVAIGDILVEKVCAFLETLDFERAQLKYVEVNLSLEQCIQPNFAHKLLGVMHRHDIAPGLLNLEFTETAEVYSQLAMERTIRTLSDAGVAFSLDDYGTGYSNIARTMALPCSLVKLDKSLVDGLNDPAMREILASTVGMMKRIGKDVLAEGVESQGQVDALRSMGVDYIQGYFFSKPLSESDFVKFLEERNA